MNIILLDDTVHPVSFLSTVYRYTVHTEPPAVVPGSLPVPLLVRSRLQPGEMKLFAELVSVNQSVFTGFSVRKPEDLSCGEGEDRGEEQDG